MEDEDGTWAINHFHNMIFQSLAFLFQEYLQPILLFTQTQNLGKNFLKLIPILEAKFYQIEVYSNEVRFNFLLTFCKFIFSLSKFTIMLVITFYSNLCLNLSLLFRRYNTFTLKLTYSWNSNEQAYCSQLITSGHISKFGDQPSCHNQCSRK